jgi:hypothetical protein
MAITRAQLPEQIDVFQNGGDATLVEPLDVEQVIVYGNPLAGSSSVNRKIKDSSRLDFTNTPQINEDATPSATKTDGVLNMNTMQTDQTMSELEKAFDFLEKNKSKLVPDFSTAYAKYAEMLKPFNSAPVNASIYDFATSLSKGLTAQMQSGQPASIGAGLAMGFNSFSDFINAKKAANQERMDRIRQQAATLAIEDVREGEKLYNTMLTERLLKDESKLGKVIYFTKKNDVGEILTETAYEKDKPAIDDLLSQGYSRVKDTGNTFNLGETGPTKVENQFILDAHNNVKGVEEKATASLDNDQNLAKFRFLQDQIPEEGLGKGANLVGELKEFLVDLPIVGEHIADKKIVAARQALKNTQIGFVLGIVGPYKGAISNKELAIFQASVAGLANEKKANEFILITGARANEIMRNRAIAERDEYNKLYKQWIAKEITGPELTAGMNRFRQEWARPDNPQSMIFTDEVLQQLGKKREDLPTNNREALAAYEKDLIAEGVSEEEAKRLAKEMFLGIDDFTSFYEDYKNDYNNKVGDDDVIPVP